MKIWKLFGLALTFAAISACSETPIEPVALDASFAQRAQGEVPFKGVLTHTSASDDAVRPGPSYDPGCVAAGPTWVPATTTFGHVKATHIGKSTLTQNGCIEISNLAVGGPFLATGEATITSANGDELHYTYNGFVHQGTFLADVDVVITGGTGRFAGASGEFSSSSEGHSLVFPVVYPFNGVISSVGSSK